MFKALLLQQWFGLSDPALEDQIADRLSFRRFLGLSLSDKTPDHATVWRFREDLGRSGLSGEAFAEIERQIECSGLMLKQGTLIDASLVPAAVNRPPPPPEMPPPDADGRPASKLVRSPLDPDAAWTRKDGKYHFGYKIHVGLDLESRFIRRRCFTPANINDSVPADQLICGDERRVYADKAYDSRPRRLRLKAQGVGDGIMRRANRWHPLGRWEVVRNRLLVRRRASIEPLFALLKNVYRLARARYRGLSRNAAHLDLAITAANLKRWTQLA
jgi:IS5 family transposase